MCRSLLLQLELVHGLHETIESRHRCWRVGYDRGQVVLVEATPEGFRVKGQFDAPKAKGPAWAHPVVHVTWTEAVAYAEWIGGRLATEAEWVWAVRYQGGNGALKFAWGKDWPPRRDAGNYADKSAADLVPTIIPTYDDGFASTAEGGKFPANAIGIFDGAGDPRRGGVAAFAGRQPLAAQRDRVRPRGPPVPRRSPRRPRARCSAAGTRCGGA